MAEQSATTRTRRIVGECRSAAQLALTEDALSLAAGLLACSELLAKLITATERLDRQRESVRAQRAAAESPDGA